MAKSNQICRTCLQPYSLMIPLFKNTSLPQKIFAISSIVVSPRSNLPAVVCAKCVLNIDLAFSFRQIMINSDARLKRAVIRKASERYTQEFKDKNAIRKPLVCLSEVDQNESKLNKASVVISKNNSSPKRSLLDHDNHSDESGETFKNIKLEAANFPSIINFSAEQSSVNSNVKSERCDETLKDTNMKVVSLQKQQPPRILIKSEPNARPSNILLRNLLCQICGKLFNRNSFAQHLLSHNEVPVNCKVCGKTVKSSLTLRYHMNMHNPPKRICEYCGKTFKHLSNYVTHVNAHTGNRRYKCDMCVKRFTTSDVLKKHMLTHTGERPYPCKYCKKGFTSRYALKTHIRQHTNEKPYTCEHCSMGFHQKVSLKTHLKSRHSEAITS